MTPRHNLRVHRASGSDHSEEAHLDCAEARLRNLTAEWRHARPSEGELAFAFVTALVELNEAEVHRLVYDTAPALPALSTRVEHLVAMMSDEIAFHLRRWGHGATFAFAPG